MVKIHPLLLLCLTACLQAEIPPVHYWTDEARTGWLAAVCGAEGAGRLTFIQPDGKVLGDFLPLSEGSAKAAPLYLISREIPHSGWWHDYVSIRMNRKHGDVLKHPPSHFWEAMDASATLRSSTLYPGSLPATPIRFTPLAEAAPLESSDPLVEAHGLKF